MKWTTRQERPGDRGAVRAVVEAAFPTAAEADLVDALRRDPAWIPELSMVTEDPGGGVVGYALVTRCRVGDGPAERSAALALAPVAVMPDRQRGGAGGAAVRAVLAEAAARAATGRGERLVVVLGHPEYYPRFGFARASSLGVGVAFEVPDEALMALVLDGPGPVPSGTVSYPAPFGV